jgi:hypothetical protein
MGCVKFLRIGYGCFKTDSEANSVRKSSYPFTYLFNVSHSSNNNNNNNKINYLYNSLHRKSNAIYITFNFRSLDAAFITELGG